MGEKTNKLIAELEELETKARDLLGRITSREELEAARIRFLGRKEGALTAIMRALGELSAEERPTVGAVSNRVKQAISDLLEQRASDLTARAAAAPGLDLTLPGRSRWLGARHPVTQVIDEICDVLATLGFTRARGPEVESDWYNFIALNTPLDHPSADMHDTFYVASAGGTKGGTKGGAKGGYGSQLLRSHTSPVQIRTMQEYQPPIRVAIPGMVYRRDPFDASHAPGFEQLEGLAVDVGITFVDLKATIAEFARRFFGTRAQVRFRPSFFPFTEPSAEVDVSCLICGGTGCSACKGTGWMEIMGAGMVHPALYRNVGWDDEKYTGFAFGMGPGRIAMLRYGLPDIRLLYDSDVRFLQQFA